MERSGGTIAAAVNTANTIAVYSFMDSSLVYILDTAFGPHMLDQLKRRIDGKVTVLMVYKGIVIYNGKMGGVDAWDAIRTGYFAVEMTGRTAKWTVRFGDSMFNLQLTQAWIAHRHVQKLQSHTWHDNRLRFEAEICEEFLDNTEDDQRCYETRQADEHKQLHEFGRHHDLVTTTAKECTKQDGIERLKRGSCAYCAKVLPENRLLEKFKKHTDTSIMCRQCNVYLHMECMASYHNTQL